MAPTARVSTERVTKVTIDEYDQVFALTQYMINVGLQTKFLTLDKASPLRQPVTLVRRSFGRLDKAIVGYPRIVVETAEIETLTGANYMMCFDGGKLEV